MNQLTQFNYQGQTIRTVTIDGEPWFVAKDVCELFGDTNYRRSVGRLDADEKGVSPLDTPGGVQQVSIVSESGLYTLLWHMQPQLREGMDRDQYDCRVKALKDFKRWITHEVLPSIRKHGAYMTPDTLDRMIASPEFGIRLLTELQKEREQKAALQAQVAQLEPPAQAWNTLAEAHGDYSLREAAQILSRDPAIETGQNRLMRTLHLLKWVDKHGVPYQTQIDLGRLAVRTRSYTHPHTGDPQLTNQVRVTVKGLQYLHKHLGGVRPLEAPDEQQISA